MRDRPSLKEQILIAALIVCAVAQVAIGLWAML